MQPVVNNCIGLPFLCALYNVEFLPGCVSLFIILIFLSLCCFTATILFVCSIRYFFYMNTCRVIIKLTEELHATCSRSVRRLESLSTITNLLALLCNLMIVLRSSINKLSLLQLFKDFLSAHVPLSFMLSIRVFANKTFFIDGKNVSNLG